MSYCVQFGADDGCLNLCSSVLTTDVNNLCSSVLTTDVLLCVVRSDDGCLIVCSSVLTTDVSLCAVRC